MKFEDLKAAVAETTGLTQADAGKAIAAMCDQIQTSLCKGDKVSVPALGSFDVTHRAARQGRNPQTGQTIKIAASKTPKFKPSKSLKDALNG